MKVLLLVACCQGGLGGIGTEREGVRQAGATLAPRHFGFYRPPGLPAEVRKERSKTTHGDQWQGTPHYIVHPAPFPLPPKQAPSFARFVNLGHAWWPLLSCLPWSEGWCCLHMMPAFKCLRSSATGSSACGVATVPFGLTSVSRHIVLMMHHVEGLVPKLKLA